ncbi:MAG: exo-alpha-sialidase [Thermoguttaceae bacterium]|nr:exo-alpha-sialidase [Thermoguttaceae bacterium]
MRTLFLPVCAPALALFAALVCAAAVSAQTPNESIVLTAAAMARATEQPSLVTMSGGSAHLPVWSMSGRSVGQSVAGFVPALPVGCRAVRVQLLLTTEEPPEQHDLQSVWRVHLAQMSDTGAPRVVTCDCVRAGIPSGALQTEWVTAESYFPVDAALPLSVRVQREPDDPADTFTRPMGLVLVKITPLTPPDEAFLVTDTVVDGAGYNSWPMIQNIGDTLVCAYSRGRAHNIDEDAREVFAKSSRDLGRSWSDEAIVAATPGSGEVAIGKGLDSTGAMLLWVRRIDSAAHGPYRHDLYRSEDGVTFTRLATPELDPAPIQITDCFALPGHGLMALWFAGPYGDDGPSHSWGTLTSADDGKSWTQTTIESNLTKEQWPTEQSAVYLGEGKILALARVEVGGNTTARAQLQLTSTDFGVTWRRAQTNITDVLSSTPTVLYDPETDLVTCYYFHRGRGILRCRRTKAGDIFDRPLTWPDSRAAALGSESTWDTGNVNAVRVGGKDYLAFYSGKDPNTAVFVKEVTPEE